MITYENERQSKIRGKHFSYYRRMKPDGKPEKIKMETLVSTISKEIREGTISIEIKKRNMSNIHPSAEVDMYIKEMAKGAVLETKYFKYWIRL